MVQDLRAVSRPGLPIVVAPHRREFGTGRAELVDKRLHVALTRLDAHLAEERAAAVTGDRAASVRLSGAFHIHLVDALGNAELSRFLRDLLRRSSVMVSLYEPASQSLCAVDEHGAMVEALRARDVARAIDLSRRHFLHVEQRLRFEPTIEPAPDIGAIFRKIATKPKSAAGVRNLRPAQRGD